MLRTCIEKKKKKKKKKKKVGSGFEQRTSALESSVTTTAPEH